MLISSFFTDWWSPRTWLSPTIKIYDLKKSIEIVTSDPCVEVWWWFYKYDFSKYSGTNEYVMLIDWWDVLEDWERYCIVWNDNSVKMEEISHYAQSANTHAQYNNFLQKLDLLETKMFDEIKKINQEVKTVEVVKEVQWSIWQWDLDFIESAIRNSSVDYSKVASLLDNLMQKKELEDKKNKVKALVLNKKKQLAKKLIGW